MTMGPFHLRVELGPEVIFVVEEHMKAQRAPDQNPITDDIRVLHSKDARHPASGAEIDLSAVRLEERADLVGIGYASPNP